jgi:molybdopterin converting factor subunit 1
MRIRLLLFASYAELLGTHELTIELNEGASALDALKAVRARPGAERLPPKPLLAVNQRYAQPETRLAEGDEVALIPPVAGG